MSSQGHLTSPQHFYSQNLSVPTSLSDTWVKKKHQFLPPSEDANVPGEGVLGDQELILHLCTQNRK